MNAYRELRDRQQAEFNAFPMQFAFNNQQFVDGMAALGLKPEDTDKIYATPGGGFYRKADSLRLHKMMIRHSREMKEAIEADKTGDGFIFDMFDDELSNHEYTYTRDTTEAIYACGFTPSQVEADARLLHGLQKACKSQRERYERDG